MLTVTSWSFLTNHARAMLLISAHPDARLRDLADALGVTERTAYGIVADLTAAGYVVKERAGRRNRYQIQDHLPLPDSKDLPLRDISSRERTVGELLELLVDTKQPNEPGDGPDEWVTEDHIAGMDGDQSVQLGRPEVAPVERGLSERGGERGAGVGAGRGDEEQRLPRGVG